MILHTDFHDYYDNAIGFGVDKKVHYNRFTRPVDIVLKSTNNWPPPRHLGLIGFCGDIFPFIKLHKLDKLYSRGYDDSRPRIVEVYFAYSFDDYKKKESEWHDFSYDFRRYDRNADGKLRQFFSDWAGQNDAMFLELKVPVWVMNFHGGSEKNGIVYPKLKDYQFDRIKGSNAAFQEISMYLANILVEQKEVAHVEDKYRIQQHGFDLKDSFRNTKKRKENQD